MIYVKARHWELEISRVCQTVGSNNSKFWKFIMGAKYFLNVSNERSSDGAISIYRSNLHPLDGPSGRDTWAYENQLTVHITYRLNYFESDTTLNDRNFSRAYHHPKD